MLPQSVYHSITDLVSLMLPDTIGNRYLITQTTLQTVCTTLQHATSRIIRGVTHTSYCSCCVKSAGKKKGKKLIFSTDTATRWECEIATTEPIFQGCRDQAVCHARVDVSTCMDRRQDIVPRCCTYIRSQLSNVRFHGHVVVGVRRGPVSRHKAATRI
jgi:hypothetical protein